MKKSRSSVPRFADRCVLAPPPDKNAGLFPTVGRPEPVALPVPDLVEIAVGKTKDGESFPANPSLSPLSASRADPEDWGFLFVNIVKRT